MVGFHPNGSKRFEQHWKDGKPHGRWTSWYADEAKKSEGSYANGKKEGLWQEWGESGHLISTKRYGGGG